MNILDTASEENIYKSLDKILNVENGKTKEFFQKNCYRYLNLEYWEIDLDLFYKEFSLESDFCIDGITIYHITTRLEDTMKENFVIDNLETVLLTENSLTKFLKDYQIEFNKKEDGIDVFYNGGKCQFKGSENARLRNRLCKLNDSCVNGFLFNEKMDYMYIGLTGMPEIFSDLMNSLGRTDLKQEYLKRRKSYEVTIKVPIDDLIFDDDSQIQNCSEKTKLILKYVTNYLCYKMSKGKCYCFNNPIIRLPDDKNVDNEYIHAIRCIEDAKEIFKW